MSFRHIDGTDAYNFPDDFAADPQLAWIGDDYLRLLIGALHRELRRHYPGAAILSIKCETQPELFTQARQGSHMASAVTIRFRLQILLRDGAARYWRLRGQSDLMLSAPQDDRVEYTVALTVTSSERAS